MKSLELEDEYGVHWLAFEPDPAYPLCTELSRVGVKELVLPRFTLVTGGLPVIIRPDFSKLDVSNEAVAQVVRRTTRMHDCLHYLKTWREREADEARRKADEADRKLKARGNGEASQADAVEEGVFATEGYDTLEAALQH